LAPYLHRRHCLALLGSAAFGNARAVAPIPAVVPDDVLADFRRFLAGRRPEALREFTGPHSRRDVVEVALLHLALAGEAQEAGLILQPAPTAARLQRELIQGNAACSGTSFWREDLGPDETALLFSRAVLQEGEFEAGLYTVPGNRRALAARQLADVLELGALCNRSWRVDWLTLQQLGFRNIQHAGNWDLMPRMLAGGRADFVLAPFQATADLSLVVGGVTLVPIPGIKVLVRGTRHYLISARRPGALALQAQLDSGITRLRRLGVLRRAYVASGFINPAVAEWAVLGRL